MLRTYDFLQRTLFLLLAFIYVLLALYLSVGRFYLPQLPKLVPQIESYLDESTGLQWQLDNLRGEWQKFNPVFRVDRITATDTENSESVHVFELRNGLLRLDVLQTLLDRQLRLTDLSSRSLSIGIEQAASNRWQLRGLQGGTAAMSLSPLSLINHLREVAVDEIQLIYWEDAVATELPIMELSLSRYGATRRISLRQADLQQGTLEFKAETSTKLFADNMQGTLYCRAQDVDLDSWLSILPEGWSVKNWTGEYWVNRQKSGQWRVISNLQSADLSRGDASEWNLAHLAMQSAAIVEPGKRASLWWQTLDATWNGQQLNIPVASADVDFQNGEVSLISLIAPEINLGQVSEILLGSEILPPVIDDLLDTLKPRGLANNFRISMPNSERLVEFELSAELHDAGADPWGHVPGIDGIDGRVSARARSGSVELESTDGFSMFFPDVYHQPLGFDTAKGQVWWDVGERVTVGGSDLSLTSGAERAGGSFYVTAPVSDEDEDPTYMSLTIGVQDGRLEELGRYLPFVLSDGLLGWIEAAELSGQVVDGGFLLNGSLRKGDGDQRSVNLYFNVADAGVRYESQWPRGEGVDALVNIDNELTTASVLKGDIAGVDISDSLVEVYADSSGNGHVRVEGQASGELDQALSIVKQSPLRAYVGGLVDDWSGAGQVEQAQLLLNVPLQGVQSEKSQSVKVDFCSMLNNATVDMNNLSLVVEQASGPLCYSSEEGLTSTGIDGMLWGEPVAIVMGAIDESEVNDRASLTRVEVEGSVDVSNLAHWLNQPLLLYLQGASQFDVRVDHFAGSTTVSARSDLQGVEIDVPDALHKASETAADFDLEWLLNSGAQPMYIEVENRATMSLMFDDFVLQSGEVFVGKTEQQKEVLLQKADTKDGRHLTVAGLLDSLNLSAWISGVKRYSAFESAIAANSSRPVKNEADAEEETIAIRLRDMRVDSALAFGETFTNNIVNMDVENAGWLFKLESDQLKGNILLPVNAEGTELISQGELQQTLLSDSDGIDIDLEYLRFPARAELQSDALQPKEFQSVAAASLDSVFADFDLLPMSVNVDQLFYAEKGLGRWRFNIEPGDNSVLVDAVAAEVHGLSIRSVGDGGLRWRKSENGSLESYLQLAVSSEAFSDFLSQMNRDWGWAQSPIVSDRAEVAVDLHWPASPNEFSVQNLSGNLAFTLRDGQFLRASDSAENFLKVVGLVNLDSLVRRLRLDFSDLYSSGLSFDELAGAMTFKDSQVLFNDSPILVKSPSSQFLLSGGANLELSTIDAELIATLPIASNLPWIAALVAGLPAAAGVFVASKIFEKEVNRFSSAVYSVEGPLDNPELKFQRLFDMGGGKKREAPRQDNAASGERDETSEPVDGAISSSTEIEAEKAKSAAPEELLLEHE